jgi:DNA repair exonuclease SbcCD nuclease subunit
MPGKKPVLRFVHAADLHLDSPFVGLKSIAPDVAARLRDATFGAYDAIVALCIRERVDALLVAGDIYDGADRSLRAQLRFVEGLRRLEAECIPSFVCHGNHDPLDGWEARLALPAGCHRFGPELEGIPLDPEDPGKATVYGMSYPTREVRENLVKRFGHPSKDGIRIGLLHCNAGGNPEHEAYSPCTIEDLASAGVDYWALGHVHGRQVLRDQSPTIVYPGNPQGLQPNEAGARGVYLVEIRGSGNVSLDFRPVDTVRWMQIEVSVERLETEQGLLDLIESMIEQARATAQGRDIVFRMRITGRGSLHYSLRRPDFAGDLQQEINNQWSTQEPFAWCERVEDATKTPLDRERARRAGDFVGDLLRLVDEANRDQGLLDELAAELETLFGHGRARQYLRELAPSREDLCALLADAETRCLDLLVGEEGG